MHEEILALAKQFEQAIANNDAATLGRLLADGWIVIDPDGAIIGKSRFLGAIASGILRHQEMTSDEIRVGVHGNTATVTALTTSKGTFLGQQFTSLERATDVFVNEDGRWQCVLTQLTRFAKK